MVAAIDEEKSGVGILVLAAGGSRRMTRIKQLLRFEGRSLLRRAVETAIETGGAPVVVVLGANEPKIRPEIQDLKAQIIFNPDWEKGLSSSLKAGIEHLLAAPNLRAALVTLADQPFVSARHLASMMEKSGESKNAIIAAAYRKTIGVPALFPREFFAELCALNGDQGAKHVIKNHRESLVTVDLPEAAFDIDTPEDFSNLGKSGSR